MVTMMFLLFSVYACFVIFLLGLFSSLGCVKICSFFLSLFYFIFYFVHIAYGEVDLLGFREVVYEGFLFLFFSFSALYFFWLELSEFKREKKSPFVILV